MKKTQLIGVQRATHPICFCQEKSYISQEIEIPNFLAKTLPVVV
jgi:hypothetical protein